LEYAWKLSTSAADKSQKERLPTMLRQQPLETQSGSKRSRSRLHRVVGRRVRGGSIVRRVGGRHRVVGRHVGGVHVGRGGILDDQILGRQVVDRHRVVVCAVVAAASCKRQGRTGDQDKSTHSK